jgi:membrane protein implicated in regulation of membrane protease activity
VNELTGDALGIAAVVFIAIVAAIPLAILASYLVKRMSNMRTDATPTRADLVGTRGVVVTPIPAGGFGEVRVRIGGQPVKLSARAERPVPLGTKVVVTSAVSDTSVIVQEVPEQ